MVITDNIVLEKKRTRRKFCSYYTESDPILSYMVSRLNIQNGDLILEPCAGDGVFIEKIINSFPNQDYNIDALDLNPKAICQLQNCFHQRNISIRETDTLLDITLDICVNMNGYYTKIIGNPPYGAWQDYEKRNVLKKIYGGYTRETYTLFIQRCIELLKENGKLIFIVPDTFLALHLHKGTREKILKNTKIEEILLIPSNFFPGVNFGYSNLCIISLIKTNDVNNHKIKIVRVNRDIENLYNIIDFKYDLADDIEEISQTKVLNSTDYAFFLGSNTKIRKLLNKSPFTLGDLANCVTGFCSGDNKKFFKPLDLKQKGTKDYDAINKLEVEFEYLQFKNILDGLQNDKKYIPILKGGRGNFKKKTDWFVVWNKETVHFYRNNKKSRFQNSQYYFKEGLGVPMVRGNKINSFLLEKRIFDQSIVGIFPKNRKDLLYLLAFLNSDVCNRILKVINHTTNNSANYLKKLPVIIDENYFKEVNRLVRNILNDNQVEFSLSRINDIFHDIYLLNKDIK